MESITELRVEFLEPKLFLIKITTRLDHEKKNHNEYFNIP